MTLPTLPNQGATNWYAWASAVHAAVESGGGGGGGDAAQLSSDNTFTGANAFAFAPTVNAVAVATTNAPFFTGQVAIGVTSSSAPTLEEYPSQGAPKTFLIRDHLAVRRRLGVGGAEPSQRLPINFSTTMDGSALTNEQPVDKVVFQNTVTIKGDFTNETTWAMPSASHIFGANDFVVTGSAAGDAAGITNIYGRLSEVHVYAPGRTMSQITAFQTEAHIEASATGTNVTSLVAIQVKAPRNAGGGTLTNAYGIKIESPTVGTNRYAIHSSGVAAARFGGAVITARNTAPADAELITGELAIWYDSTSGASKLMVKAKQADGTVKTASLALTT